LAFDVLLPVHSHSTSTRRHCDQGPILNKLSEEKVIIEALLADDESLARLKLRQLLREDPEIRIVGEAGSALETIDLVRASSPQLLFLDIRMPGMDAFDMMDALLKGDDVVLPHIVFTTAYDDYALRAFEIHAVDYLLKPFTLERLQLAVHRVREQIIVAENPARHSEAVGRATHRNRYSTRIVFKSRGRILFLPVSDIRWIGAEENYVRICTGAETHLLRETMAGIEQKLDPEKFLRVHRSAIVNLQYVKEVRTEPQGEFIVQLVNGERVTMSRSYHTRIGEMLERP
jgi:two-component system, LytTR family, response regulator